MVKRYLLSPGTEFTRTENKNRSRKVFLIINTINKPANRTSLTDTGVICGFTRHMNFRWPYMDIIMPKPANRVTAEVPP